MSKTESASMRLGQQVCEDTASLAVRKWIYGRLNWIPSTMQWGTTVSRYSAVNLRSPPWDSSPISKPPGMKGKYRMWSIIRTPGRNLPLEIGANDIYYFITTAAATKSRQHQTIPSSRLTSSISLARRWGNPNDQC